jgi:alkylhydroperoxidase family enzyme
LEDTVSTIRLLEPADAVGKVREIFDAVLARESRVFGATSVSNIWRCMGHSRALLEANWNRSRALMQRGRFTPLQRELIATAVSAANACHY